jgi:competence protein ComEA
MTKNRYWALTIILLIAVIATGGILTWQKYHPPHPIEISLPPSPQFQGDVYIGGAVNNPGFYPLKAGDSIEALIQAAGGTSNADIAQLRIYIPTVGEGKEPQKIDINRAEAWLLEALPGIGETLAQRIIDYRQQHGAFRSITEITNVQGIGPSTYDKIKPFITVAD